MPEQSQYEAAFEKGRAIIHRRSRFRKEVANGEAKLSEVLAEEKLPEWLENAKLGPVLRVLPGVGPAMAKILCEELPSALHAAPPWGQPSPASTLCGLEYRQRVALSIAVERFEKP